MTFTNRVHHILNNLNTSNIGFVNGKPIPIRANYIDIPEEVESDGSFSYLS